MIPMRDWCEVVLRCGSERGQSRSYFRQIGFVIGPRIVSDSEDLYTEASQKAVGFPQSGQVPKSESKCRLKMGCCLGSNWSCLSKLRRNSKVNTERPFWGVEDRDIRKLRIL